MVTCTRCERELRGPEASITYVEAGDTWDEAWYLCLGCNAYTRTLSHEVFLLEDDHTRASGPFPRSEGDQRVALLRTCPDPGNARCRCDVHLDHA